MSDCFLDSIVYEYNNRLSVCKNEQGKGSRIPQNNSVAWQWNYMFVCGQSYTLSISHILIYIYIYIRVIYIHNQQKSTSKDFSNLSLPSFQRLKGHYLYWHFLASHSPWLQSWRNINQQPSLKYQEKTLIRQKSMGKIIERQTLLIELLLSGYPSSTLPPVSYSPKATEKKFIPHRCHK